MPVEDGLPPGETVHVHGCPWYVVPRKQPDGSYVLWDGESSVHVIKRRDIWDGVMRLERQRRLRSHG